MIVLDGIPAEQLGIHVLKDYVDPSLPPTRDSSLVIPGQHGELDQGAYFGKREFNFPMILIPQSSYQEALMKTEELKRILIDGYGKPRTFKLIDNTFPDRFYYARYSGTLPINDLLKNRFFTLPLVAYDPHGYSVFDTSNDVLWGSDIPFMSDITFGIGDYFYDISTPTTLQIENVGSLVVRPKITITGSASSMTLTISGKSFSVGGFPEGAVLLIDNQHYVVTRDGQNYISKMTGNFLELLPGKNSISITGNNLNFQISFEFHAKYM